MENEGKVRVNVVMTEEMYGQLDELRQREGKMSVPELIRSALREYIEKRHGRR